MRKKFKFYTEYNQFYIQDKNYSGDTSDSEFWSEKAYNYRLATSNDVLGVGTQSYGNIKGEIEILEKQAINVDFEQYDHIVEAGLEIKHNELQVADCPTNNIEVKIIVNNGKYRVRVYSSNLSSVLEPDLANDIDDDYYRIEVWPDEDMERKVLKQYMNNMDRETLPLS